MKSPKNLILYKDFENGKLFYNMTWIMENYENEYYNKEDVESLLYESLNQLMELAVSHGFVGNLWHSFLAFLLVNNENAYSKACEIRGEVEGSVNQIVLHDFEIIKSLFDFDFGKLASYFEMDCMDAITDYQSMTGSGKIFNKRIKERINELKLNLEASTDVSGFKDAVTAFYKDFGVGKLGLHKAFRIQNREKGDVEIVPITNIAHVKLDDLVGYELAKQKLIDNTEAFVNGKQANNCLLYGDAGTGKSTSIKAIANQYYDRGLRLIEVYKHQFCDLNDVIAQIKNRNYKFIIYMDDLSFEEFEIEYKYLKAVIEGGLEKKPDNVLIYATSVKHFRIKRKCVRICILPILYRKNYPCMLDLVFPSTLAHRTRRNSRILSKYWQKNIRFPWMRTLCLLRPINGSFPTADYPAGRHSNLSTIYLEKNKKLV